MPVPTSTGTPVLQIQVIQSAGFIDFWEKDGNFIHVQKSLAITEILSARWGTCYCKQIFTDKCTDFAFTEMLRHVKCSGERLHV
jgi:hypothetical protein